MIKAYYLSFFIFVLLVIYSCMNEIPQDTATIVVDNSSDSYYYIDTVRIFKDTNYDRSKENLLNSGELINGTGSKSFSVSVLEDSEYFIEVRYLYYYPPSTYNTPTNPFFIKKIDSLKKDDIKSVTFIYTYP